MFISKRAHCSFIGGEINEQPHVSKAHPTPSVLPLAVLYIICRLFFHTAERSSQLPFHRQRRQTLGLLSISMATTHPGAAFGIWSRDVPRVTTWPLALIRLIPLCCCWALVVSAEYQVACGPANMQHLSHGRCFLSTHGEHGRYEQPRVSS